MSKDRSQRWHHTKGKSYKVQDSDKQHQKAKDLRQAQKDKADKGGHSQDSKTGSYRHHDR